MRHVRGMLVLAALGLAGLITVGCVERRERIVVEPDGWVRIHLEFETDSFDELYDGDAVPTVDGGWLVEERVERDEEGKETFRLVADAAFGPEEPLPGHLAGPRDPAGDVSTQFPTAVTVEVRRDGTYFHFARRYERRRWAHLESARDELEELVGAVDLDDPAALPLAERAALVRGVARFETAHIEVFARAAFLDVMPEVPQDVWLRVRAAIADTARSIDADAVAALFSEEDEARRDAALDEQRRRLEEETLRAVERVLRGPAGVAEGRVNAFIRRLRWHQRFHEITDELGDDAFTVTVQLPGEIVGHNGETGADGEVTWKFGGASFRDRDRELLATSRVGR